MAEDLGPRIDSVEANELRERVARLEQQVALLQQLLPVSPRRAAAPEARVVAEPVPLPSAPAFGAVIPAARKASLESDLGAKVISKIAVVLLLVGAAWFLKWSFDNHWIGPAGRVVIGLLAGAGIVVWSERFRKSGTPAFSYALKAVGSGVLYLSLWASFQLYHLVPAPVAFAAMLGITAWNIVMAIAQESIVLAAYALLGAYLTPALLSTGGDHEVFLLSYLAVIAAGTLLLLRARPWNLLLVAVLPVTTVYYIGWYSEYFAAEKAGVTSALSLLLWAVFAAMPLLAKDTEDALVGVLQPLAAGVFGALTMYSVLVDSGHRAMEAWVAVAFAAVYLALSRMTSTRVVSAMHVSLSLTFLTVAIPLKATGHGIAIGWLAEAVAVFWLAGMVDMESRARAALQWLGCVSLVLGVGWSLLGPIVLSAGNTAFWNRNFATAMGAVVALLVAMALVKRWPAKESNSPSATRVAGMAVLLLNLELLVMMRWQIGMALHYGETSDFVYSGWMAVQGAGMLAAGFWKRAAMVRWLGLILLGMTLAKTVLYDMRHLGTGYRVVSYLALGVLLMGVSYAYQKDWLGLHAVAEKDAEL